MNEVPGPNVYIVAGPNGAGKSTFAKLFLPEYADCREFVNADLIAELVIVRRFRRGISNLFDLYMPLLDSWLILDNSGESLGRIAEGLGEHRLVHEPEIFGRIREAARRP